MSGINEDDKLDPEKSVPLDLAAKLTAVKTMDVKPPLIMPIRSMRVLTTTPNPAQVSVTGSTIITANLMPQVLKQGTQITSVINTGGHHSNTANITIQRPTHITLSTATVPLAATTVTPQPPPTPTYHVPRGPAVVANLAAPRGIVTAAAAAIRSPLVIGSSHTATVTRTPVVNRASGSAVVVTSGGQQQQQTSVAWLTATGGGSTSTSNGGGSHVVDGLKVAQQGVVRGGVVGKGGGVQRTQMVTTGGGGGGGLASIRPTIIQSTIPHGAQIHTFKTGAATVGNITNAVTIAQVLPNRTQTLVYSTGNHTQFTNAPRLSVGSTAQGHRQISTPRSAVTAARLSIPTPQQQQQQLSHTTTISASTSSSSRLVSPPGTTTTVLTTSGVRISTVNPPTSTGGPHHHPNLPAAVSLGPASTRGGVLPTITTSGNTSVSSATTAAIGRLTSAAAVVAAAAAGVSGAGGGTVAPAAVVVNSGGARISTLNLHSLVAVASSASSGQVMQGGGGGGKVITQPAQGTAIHITQMPTAIKSTQNICASSVRTNINVKPSTIVTQRQTPIVASQTLPIGKVYPQSSDLSTPTANVFIHTPVPSIPKLSSPGPLSISETNQPPNTTSSMAATYSIANNPYYYDAAANYAVSRNYNTQQQPTTFAISQVTTASNRPPITTQNQLHVSNPSMRFNSIMLVEPSKAQPTSSYGDQQHTTVVTSETNHSAASSVQSQIQQSKLTSSPRPSILRKRDSEGSPLKAAKNLIPSLVTPLGQHHLQKHQQPQPIVADQLHSPNNIRPDSRGNGNTSEGGSTTISASSSPGLAEDKDDIMSHIPMNIIKEEEENRPPLEMSPRKKPRKQNLAGNDLDEHHDDMQFLSEHRDVKKEVDESEGNHSDAPRDGAPEAKKVAPIRKPASASLLNSYRQTWKTTNNHYMRYTDVKPKDERRPSIMDLSNQCRVLDKVNGWKIHHLSTQMEDLADQEQTVYNQLTELLKYTESKEWNSHDKDVNRINELIKGNLQRIKIINDGMIEAKSQILKIFDHKSHVTDIISRCASKRNYKKREKS